MRTRFNPLLAAMFCFFILLLADVNLAAQGFALPQPMNLTPVEPLNFAPDASNSCMSVEGPEHLKNDSGQFTAATLPDTFTSCALTIFAPLLKFKDGTQKTDEATDALSQCPSASTAPKHFILVGHGDPGLTATGNGTNPQDDQSINNRTKAAIDKVRTLKASELVLFSCNTGVGDDGAQLLKQIAKDTFVVRARNSDVICYDGTGPSGLKGLYVLKGSDLHWVTAQPNNADMVSQKEATVDFNPAGCLALKGADQQFHPVPSDEFKTKRQHREIFVSDFRSEAAQRLGLFSEFELLPKGGGLTKNDFLQLLTDDTVFNNIDFCQMLPPGAAPDRTIIGSFTITIDHVERRFYELRGGLAQDVEHDDVYYPMKPHTVEGLAQHIRTKWNEKLNQLKLNKLQKNSDAGKAHN